MPAIHRLVTMFKAEFPRLFKFAIIGSSSLVLTLALYALLSRVLWKDGPRTVEYFLVVVAVSLLNYDLNRRFTFGAKERSVGSLGRFTTVAVIAVGINNVLFWLGHEVFHLLDFAVITGNALIVASFTFSSHRMFTFHPEPWRHFRKVARSK